MTSSPRKKRVLFKLVTTLISSLVCVLVVIGGDLYLHHKHGINFHGYRGRSLGPKQSGEKRIAFLGGSTTWGFGVLAGQDIPAQLEQMLAERSEAAKSPITIVNLGANNDGAYSFKFTLNDYDYLGADVVVLYSGYNDLFAPNYYVFRHRSPVFVWTGYLPLLPLLTADKLTVWKRQLLGQNQQKIFQPPDLKQIKSPQPLETAIQPGSKAVASSQPNSGTCSAEWSFYCEQISETVNLCLKKGKRVLVVTEPYISNSHVAQQRAIEAMLAARFAGNPNVRYLNLGTAVDLRDATLCWDGMHLTREGNRRIAAALVEPVTELARP